MARTDDEMTRMRQMLEQLSYVSRPGRTGRIGRGGRAGRGGLSDGAAPASAAPELPPEPPPPANPPVITSGNAFETEENTNDTIFTVTATGGEGPLVFTIEGGADGGIFGINEETGEVSLDDPPDFETPLDADTDNVYELTVGVSDGVNPVVTQAVSVTVTDVVEIPSTVALSHFDGDESDPLVDEMPGVFWNAYGGSDTFVNTADPKFGTGHITESNGTGMYLAGFDPLTNDDDWTIEYFFVNVTHSFTSAVVFGYSTPGTPDTGPSPTGSPLFTQMRQADVELTLSDATEAPVVSLSSASGPSMDVYHHAAFVKEGTTASMYVDGVRLATDTIVGVVADIVAFQLTDNGPFTTKFDEFRVSRVARYSGASFTPPAAPFVVD